jgi:Leucine-rich repeat (LRR) protein
MNRKRPLITIAFSAILLFVSLNACLSKNDEKEDIVYDNENDFVVNVWYGKTVSIINYVGSSKDVRIPPRIGELPVTIIESDAFKEKSLTSVIIPDSVTHIGTRAFQENRLTSITLPQGITVIENNAFARNYLTSVTIPDSVTRIGIRAFERNQLTHAVIPNSVTHIGEAAFSNNKLTEIIIPDRITSIEATAFENNNLTSITIPEGVRTIGDYAFKYNKLTEIIIPQSVTSIGREAFRYNDSITKITIGENVKLGYYAFSDFDSFYDLGVEKRGGTYIYGNYHWSPEDKTIPVLMFTSEMSRIFPHIIFFADMPDLEKVWLRNNDLLTDITPLAGLKKLSSLIITRCPNIESLEPLSSLTDLKYLTLEHNNNYDYSALVPLRQLEGLSIYTHGLDLSHIGQLHSLKSLSLYTDSDATIKNINELQNLVNLEKLEIYSLDNLDISWMSSLRNLTELDMEFCTIDDISPLASLPNLVNIDLTSCRIKDIAPLLNSNSIKYIRVWAHEVEAGISDDLRSRFEQKNIYLDTFYDYR